MTKQDFSVDRLAGLIDAIGGFVELFVRPGTSELDILNAMSRDYGYPTNIRTTKLDDSENEWYNVYIWELREYPNTLKVTLFGDKTANKEALETLAKAWTADGGESV